MAKETKNEVLYRAYSVFVILLLVAVLIFSKAFSIGIVEGEKWKSKSDSLFIKEVPAMGERGNVLAYDGTIIATSVPFFDVYMDINADGLTDQVFENNIDSLSYYLAKYVDKTKTPGAYKSLLERERKSKNRYLLIKKNVNFHLLNKIKQFPLFRLGKFKGGLIVNPYDERMRPYKGLAARTLGYVNEGFKIGIEGKYNKDLIGEEGKQIMQKVGNNLWMPIDDLTEIEPKKGNDVVTTLDIDIQDFVHKSLYEALKFHNADFGTAIVMEVKTGAIKAISNLGKKDNDWTEVYNYGIGTATEPGSTFKLASIVALLEDGYITLEDTVNLNYGTFNYGSAKMKDSHPHNITLTTVKNAFEMSSNVGISQLVQKYYGSNNNAAQFINRLKKIGLDKPTNIDIDGEAMPFIKTAYNESQGWSYTSLPWISIGYESLLTPLQILNFYNSIANNGKMMKPYLIDHIEKEGLVIKSTKPQVLNKQVVSAKNLPLVRKLLEGVVENGTAKNLKTDQYNFAGKTGTAQQGYNQIKSGKNIKYQATFAGYFPAENPIYSCIVVITNPKDNGYYGGYVAGPVFRKIMDRCFSAKSEFYNTFNKGAKPKLNAKNLPNKGVGTKKDLMKLFSYLDFDINDLSSDNQYASVNINKDSFNLLARRVIDNKIPNLLGMGLRDAVYILENMGAKVQVTGAGKVKYQSVPPGSNPSKQVVRLILE